MSAEQLQAKEDKIVAETKDRQEEMERVRQEKKEMAARLAEGNKMFSKPRPWARDVKKKKRRHKEEVKKKKGECKTCAANKLKRMVTGGVKLLKSELGVDAADEETMARRKAICLKCPVYDFGVCVEEKGGCGCFVAAKIKLEGEECPKGKW